LCGGATNLWEAKDVGGGRPLPTPVMTMDNYRVASFALNPAQLQYHGYRMFALLRNFFSQFLADFDVSWLCGELRSRQEQLDAENVMYASLVKKI
jgi:hypothetical protein